ncbi:PIG-L deacetylase family protein [Alkalihalobacillus sp. AL-G]|uniref:PIG-L deacetylase family protein n=1 Tax=Alkalihalobacillus sp. AL-G TaxID=2926399 RepID=UPI00272AFADA|nr:PIG-L deacetylase family protein [Alkalihalobacillus sp. AL-G]WLD94937.1 PIG-L family deacetylase [Alkalihalobacillus sp. AL-G]
MLEYGKERILIIAPHADDEVLGCGGLIEKAVKYGNDVKVVIAAVGDIVFEHKKDGETTLAQTRISELHDALMHLGCSHYEILYDDKESKLDTIPLNEIVTRLDKIIALFQPTMVFIPYPSYHQDHQVLFQASMASLRPDPRKQIKLVAMYEYPLIVWQYPKINDVGELFLDISNSIELKLEAFCKHQSQMRDPKHLISPENVKRWAAVRGMEAGVDYAEKYHLLRSVIL